MKTIKLFSFIFFLMISANSFAQESTKTGQIYLIRSTGYEGSAVNYSFYVDDQLVCKLKNKHFSIIDIPAGDHNISVLSGGLSNGKKSAPTLVTVLAGKPNFVEVVSTQKGEYTNKITATEITENSAKPILSTLTQKTNCLE
ncbi:MAG: DUF2846 domain-containing protein [Flavobacterium sp.]|nr:MAG: DUF2846 domain-containing protein [Flavobacterium sp.]